MSDALARIEMVLPSVGPIDVRAQGVGRYPIASLFFFSLLGRGRFLGGSFYNVSESVKM